MAVCTLIVIIVIVLWGWHELPQKAAGIFQSPDIQVLEPINSVQLLPGGLLGKDKSTEILYRGCLDMRYGVDLPELTDKHYQNGR